MAYPCDRCNMDDGSPVCLMDARCISRGPGPSIAQATTGASTPEIKWRELIRHDDGRPATDAEVWAELERLRRDCAEAYQVLGAISTQPCAHTARDVERALDNLCAAAEGKPRPHDDLLPWPKGAKAQRKPRKTALRRLRRMLNELEAKERELIQRDGTQVLPRSCRALGIKDAVALREVLGYFGERSGGDA